MPAKYDFETAGKFRSPTVRQISVFLDDRVGALSRLFQAFDGSDVRVVGMSVVHAIDCAIVRIICDDNDTAVKALKSRGFPTSETELVVVEVPAGHGLRSICSALLAGEVNIDYAYPLLTRPTGRAALAIHTDEIETAIRLLLNRQFTVMTEEDLGAGPLR
ncbi:MAG: acetolactate synthase [Phycisphaerae bacterium]|nr:acetolactate synthase [Phycisphaerae bacterium]